MTRNQLKINDVDQLKSDGGRIIVDVGGLEIAIFHHDGEYYAVANYCVHQAGPLCEGNIGGRMALGEDGWEWEYRDDGRIIMCPWHSWKFDITDGQNIDDPRYSVPTYDVEERDDGIILKY